jgi:hypothetical protein
MSYDWKPYSWQQARDEDGKPAQHVPKSGTFVGVGQQFEALCGAEVTPWAEDMRSGMSFAPTCQVCTVVRAHMNGFQFDPKRPGANTELARLARRWEWNDKQITQLADALHWPARWVKALVAPARAETVR